MNATQPMTFFAGDMRILTSDVGAGLEALSEEERATCRRYALACERALARPGASGYPAAKR